MKAGMFKVFDREFSIGISPNARREQAELIATSKRMDVNEVDEAIKQAQTDASTRHNAEKRKLSGRSTTFLLC